MTGDTVMCLQGMTFISDVENQAAYPRSWHKRPEVNEVVKPLGVGRRY